MKTFKILVLLVLIMLSSCNPPLHTEPEFVFYNLNLNFQDSAGNDLINGIKFNKSLGSLENDLYSLDIIVSEKCWNWDNDIYNSPARPGFEPDVHRPTLGLAENNDYFFLTNQFGLPVNDCPKQTKLTYKIKCAYVFGDEEVHELITYWNISKDNPYAKCYRIEFKDNEITPTSLENYNNYYKAIIILE